MHERDEVILKVEGETFKVPSDFKFMSDFNQDIFQTLTTNHQYEVKSNVSKDIFQSFIDHWVNQRVPQFTEDNIIQYEQLSQEFDRMKDLIQLYKKHIPNKTITNLINANDDLKKQISYKNDILHQKIFKYNQIIQILSKNKGIDSISRYQKIKSKLFQACKNGNIELIEFLTRKKIQKNDITYILNDNDQTAIITTSRSASGDVFIPREVEDNSKKYVITSIFKKAFKNSEQIKSIQFSDDSQLNSIGMESFANSRIEKVSIPKKVSKIESYAFFDCSNLNTIEFQLNSELKIIEESAFSNSSIESISIPKSVSRIDDYAFYSCNQLKNIEFSIDSNLTYIGQYAFAESSLEKILIPFRVSQIGACSFMNCHFLRRVEFSEDSELNSFEIELFTNSAIESISIPSSIIQFKKGWCSTISTLKDIKIIENKVKNISLFDNNFIQLKSNSKSEVFDILAFARRNLKYAFIPPFIKVISDYAFNSCLKLSFIQFDDNSKLNSIGQHAFSKSSIEILLLPSNLNRIDKYAFNRCVKFEKVCFDVDSDLRKIDEFAFAASKIGSFSVPSKVDEIGNFAFSNCNGLKIFELHENSELKSFDKKIFSGSSSVLIMIPVNLNQIVNQQV